MCSVRNAFSGVWKDECGDAVDHKDQDQHRIYDTPQSDRQGEPCFFQYAGKYADPQHACNAKTKGGQQTDVAVEI